jgi:hypothetical protein
MSASTSSAEGSITVNPATVGSVRLILNAVAFVALFQILFRFCREAYEIRLHAINEYGRVIHEFDPYFNYRATEYLWANGWDKFSKVRKEEGEREYTRVSSNIRTT